MSKATLEWSEMKLSLEVPEDFVMTDSNKETLEQMTKHLIVAVGFMPETAGFEDNE